MEGQVIHPIANVACSNRENRHVYVFRMKTAGVLMFLTIWRELRTL